MTGQIVELSGWMYWREKGWQIRVLEEVRELGIQVEGRCSTWDLVLSMIPPWRT